MIVDAGQWQRLSALLDELLDLDLPLRTARLAELHVQEPALASELASLIESSTRAEEAQFLAGHMPAPAGFSGAGTATLSGERIGAYLIDAPLGQGGTGAVWRARRSDGRFEGEVAFKLLHLSLVGRTGARRFEREGAILARLSHPNIARLLDAGVTAAGQPYLVLELVEGERIDRHCDSRKLGVGARVELFRRVLEAVSHAHRHLVIHRDIKPNNILVGREDDVKLLDFGIAKLLQESADEGAAMDLTRDGGQALTPDYAAPEQLRGEPVTTATDVYSLGVLLHQLLTGQHPTIAEQSTPAEVVRATLDIDPTRLSSAVTDGGAMADGPALQRIAADRDTSPARLRRQLGGDLENIVAKALRKVPAERYRTVDAFHDDLRRWAAGEPVSARADSLVYRMRRFVSRHRIPVAAAALTFAAIVAGLVGTITQAHRATLASERASHDAEEARQDRDTALEQQRLLRGTNEFFIMMMRDAAGGDPGAIRKQLDRARVLIAQTSFEKPIVKVALQRQISARYMELGDAATATQLLRDAIASTEGTDLAAPTSGVPVNLACSLANILLEGSDPDAALVELDHVDGLMVAGAQVSIPSQVECRIYRGYSTLALGRYAEGVSIVRNALAMLDDAGIHKGEQRKVVRSALSLALAQDGRNADAMAIAKPLLAESEAEQGGESLAVLRRSSIVTAITRAGGDPLAALALSDADQQRANRLLGGQDDIAIGMEHGLILLALGRDAEAAESLARTGQAARAQKSVSTLALGLAEVEALLGAGQPDAALRRFGELKPLRDKAARDGRPARIESLRIDALLATARGDRRAAATSLDAADRLVADAGGASHPMAFALASARASMALATFRATGTEDAGARIAEGLSAADRALAAARRSAIQPERSSDVGRAFLLRARILSAANRGDEAAHDAESARRHLEATLGSANADTRTAAELAGKPV